MTNKKKIIIYRDDLLPYSETFIPAQGENLVSYQGFYVGISRSSSSEYLIPNDRSIILTELVSLPKLWKKAFRFLNIAHPKWFRRLRNLSPCLIHCHFGTDGFWAAKLARKLGVPLMVTFHGIDITEEVMEQDRHKNFNAKQNNRLFPKIADAWNDFLVTLIYEFPIELSKIPTCLTPDYALSKQKRLERVFRDAHCIIAVSEFIRSKLIEKGCPPEKIKVHYIGVDVDKFKPDSNVKRELIVLFVGRLVEKKGCEYLIRAMAKVQRVMPEVKLVLIGDGNLRPKLEKLASDLLRNYSFLGVQTPEQVRTWMNRAYIFSVPSVIAKSGDAEAFGIVFAEAQAMGLPVVSFASGGIPEAVAHNETGFLAPERDVEALAEYILTLLGNHSLRERFAMVGRNHVESKFNLKKQTVKLEQIYDELIQFPLNNCLRT